MTPAPDERMTAIGVTVSDGGAPWLVPRVVPVENAAEVFPAPVAREAGIRLTGSAPPTSPGRLVAVRGRRDGESLRVSETRTENVVDVFTHHPAVAPGATSVFGRPRATTEHARWEEEMLRDGSILSRRYLRAEDGSWRVIVTAHDIEAARAPLERAYGAQLTLVQVEWTRRQLDVVRNELYRRADAWRITTHLDGTSATGVPVLRIALREVTDEIRDWQRTLPAAMVEFFPLLAASTDDDGFDDDTRAFRHLCASPRSTEPR